MKGLAEKVFAGDTSAVPYSAWARLSVSLAMYQASVNRVPYCDLSETDPAEIIRQAGMSGEEDPSK